MRLTHALALLAALPLTVPLAAQAQTMQHRTAPMQQTDPTLNGPNAGRGDQTGMEGVNNPAPILRAARQRLAEGKTRDAQVLLEQAETRALTRSELASRADRPAMGGVVGHIAAARGAVLRRDRAGADMAINQALAELQNRRDGMANAPADMDTGATMNPGPASSMPMRQSMPPQAAPTWQSDVPQGRPQVIEPTPGQLPMPGSRAPM